MVIFVAGCIGVMLGCVLALCCVAMAFRLARAVAVDARMVAEEAPVATQSGGRAAGEDVAGKRGRYGGQRMKKRGCGNAEGIRNGAGAAMAAEAGREGATETSGSAAGSDMGKRYDTGATIVAAIEAAAGPAKARPEGECAGEALPQKTQAVIGSGLCDAPAPEEKDLAEQWRNLMRYC